MSSETSISEPAPKAANNSLIAVIDDDPSMGRMLSRLLAAAGLNVEVFASAEEFLDSDRLTEPSCLLLDVDLPGMGGLELQRQINKSEPRIPIIFMSGRATEQDREQALNAGALGFFNKPFNISALLSTIQSIDGLPEAKPTPLVVLTYLNQLIAG